MCPQTIVVCKALSHILMHLNSQYSMTWMLLLDPFYEEKTEAQSS